MINLFLIMNPYEMMSLSKSPGVFHAHRSVLLYGFLSLDQKPKTDNNWLSSTLYYDTLELYLKNGIPVLPKGENGIKS